MSWLYFQLIIIDRAFPGDSPVKNLPAKTQEPQVRSLRGDNSFGEGNGNPFQYSCLGHPMDRRTWQATVHAVAMSQTRLSMNTCLHNPHKQKLFGIVYNF